MRLFLTVLAIFPLLIGVPALAGGYGHGNHGGGHTDPSPEPEPGPEPSPSPSPEPAGPSDDGSSDETRDPYESSSSGSGVNDNFPEDVLTFLECFGRHLPPIVFFVDHGGKCHVAEED